MWKEQWKWLAGLAGVFALCYWMPVGTARFDHAVLEALELTKWYAREHVLLCLIPALFIAGAIGVFVSQGAVMRYLGPKAKKVTAYAAASVSGSILAGATLLLLGDLLARVVLMPVILPIGALTSFLGGPLFLYLLFKGGTRK